MHGKNHLFKWMSGLPSGSQWGQQIFKIALETPYTIDIFYLNLFMFSRLNFTKVHTFCEGHKNLHILILSNPSEDLAKMFKSKYHWIKKIVI